MGNAGLVVAGYRSRGAAGRGAAVMTGDAYRVPHGERHYTTPVPRRPGVAGIAASLPFEDWHAITYETPTRAAAVQADVVVPLLQSVVSGALAGLVVLAAGLALASRTGAPAWLTLAAAGAAVVIVACAWGTRYRIGYRIPYPNAPRARAGVTHTTGSADWRNQMPPRARGGPADGSQ